MRVIVLGVTLISFFLLSLPITLSYEISAEDYCRSLSTPIRQPGKTECWIQGQHVIAVTGLATQETNDRVKGESSPTEYRAGMFFSEFSLSKYMYDYAGLFSSDEQNSRVMQELNSLADNTNKLYVLTVRTNKELDFFRRNMDFRPYLQGDRVRVTTTTAMPTDSTTTITDNSQTTTTTTHESASTSTTLVVGTTTTAGASSSTTILPSRGKGTILSFADVVNYYPPKAGNSFRETGRNPCWPQRATGETDWNAIYERSFSSPPPSGPLDIWYYGNTAISGATNAKLGEEYKDTERGMWMFRDRDGNLYELAPLDLGHVYYSKLAEQGKNPEDYMFIFAWETKRAILFEKYGKWERVSGGSQGYPLPVCVTPEPGPVAATGYATENIDSRDCRVLLILSAEGALSIGQYQCSFNPSDLIKRLELGNAMRAKRYSEMVFRLVNELRKPTQKKPSKECKAMLEMGISLMRASNWQKGAYKEAYETLVEVSRFCAGETRLKALYHQTYILHAWQRYREAAELAEYVYNEAVKEYALIKLAEDALNQAIVSYLASGDCSAVLRLHTEWNSKEFSDKESVRGAFTECSKEKPTDSSTTSTILEGEPKTCKAKGGVCRGSPAEWILYWIRSPCQNNEQVADGLEGCDWFQRCCVARQETTSSTTSIATTTTAATSTTSSTITPPTTSSIVTTTTKTTSSSTISPITSTTTTSTTRTSTITAKSTTTIPAGADCVASGGVCRGFWGDWLINRVHPLVSRCFGSEIEAPLLTGCPSFQTCCIKAPRCEGGGIMNQCTLKKPLFCTSELKLIDDCKKCGCPAGFSCGGDSKCHQIYCTGGTKALSCGPTKPFFCDENGRWIEDCLKCGGCPSGYQCGADSKCRPASCKDGTGANSCVKTPNTESLFCNNELNIVSNCGMCGCPEGLLCGIDMKCTASLCRPLIYKGDPRDKLNIVFISDGFNIQQASIVNKAMNDAIERLLKTPPFTTNADKINFYTLAVFEDFSCWKGSEDCQLSKAKRKWVQCPIKRNDQLILIANSETTGEGIIGYSDFENDFAVFSYNKPYVFVHELGHGFGKLWDEYVYTEKFTMPPLLYLKYRIGIGSSPNCDDNPSCKKWADLIGIKGVGCFPGCSLSELYRPVEEDSIMRNSISWTFNPVGERHLNQLLMWYK